MGKGTSWVGSASVEEVGGANDEEDFYFDGVGAGEGGKDHIAVISFL